METAGIAGETTRTPLAGWGPAEDDLSKCVHCGLCLNACPTYRDTGLETESPRGRIYLMRSVKDGRIPVDDAFERHMDLCLVCRACETACPSGVPFGRMMEATRGELWSAPVGPKGARLAQRAAFEFVFPHIRIFRASFRLLAMYQRFGLQSVLRKSRILEHLPGRWAKREALLPQLEARPFEPASTHASRIPHTPRVGFLAGCVMSTVFGDVQRASVRVLERFGCQVVVPAAQGCCGALNVHGGERTHAKRMARAIIDGFLAADLDAIVINSAGCASTMKEYALLFGDEPHYLPRVHAFAALVRDFSEYLDTLPFPPTRRNTMPEEARTVTVYQDACHLRHAQRVTMQPRALLEKLECLRLVELSDPDACCGSAGVYNLEHPDMSNRILASKIESIRATGASVVVSGNPGCILQLRKGLREAGLPIEVKHIAEVLDSALTGTDA